MNPCQLLPLLVVALSCTVFIACGDDPPPGDASTCPDGQILENGECTARGRRGPGETGVDGGGGGGQDAATGDAGGETPAACRELATRCSDDGVPQICVDGGFVTSSPCQANQVCADGRCIAQDTCDAGEVYGCTTNTAQRVCDEDGLGFVDVECAPGPFCFRGECGTQICEPDRTRCGVGPQDMEVCDETGENWAAATACSAEDEEVCFEGECVTGCLASLKEPTYIGCGYWSVDLPQFEDPFGDPRVIPHAVVVANTSSQPATITVETRSGVTLPQPTVDIPAGEVRTVQFPRLDVENTARTNRSFHLTSTQPVIAYQFNPLNDVGVASNDASLLLPETSLGTQYFVVTWPSGVAFMGMDPQTAWFTIVGTTPGTTQVSITFAADVIDGGVPELQGITAGTTRLFELQQWDVLNFESESILFPLPPTIGDLTGTHIAANQKIAVFAGHEEAVIGESPPSDPSEPGSDSVCCADHLEEQLFPVKTWGTNYLAVHSPPRGSEVDYWRVIASQPGTQILTTPIISGLHGRTLGVGEWVEVESTDSFEIVANRPIMVMQFIVSQTALGVDNVTGDPAMILTVPTQQFRNSYDLLTPADYATDWVTIVRPAGAVINLDGSTVSATFRPIGDGTYEYAWVEWEPGPHHLDSESDFGVSLFGYDSAVSYGYPGGLNLNEL